jgi:hypothetical protein
MKEKKASSNFRKQDAHWSGFCFSLQNAPPFVEDRFHLNNVPSKDSEQILTMLYIVLNDDF